MIKRIFEHSIDEEILDKNGYVLDAGCGVDFYFSKYMADKGMKVISVDPNPKIINIPNHPNIYFERKAIVSKKCQNINMLIFDDIDAATTINVSNDILSSKNNHTVQCITIDEIMTKYNIKQFEVLKLDIEGSEYDILNNINSAISKQISVEFHDFRNMNPFYPENEKYYKLMFKTLLNIYKIEKHEMEIHGGMPQHLQKNYWDSLFILKNSN